MIPTYQQLPLNVIQFCQVIISLTKNQVQSPATSSNILAAKTISSILQQIRAASSASKYSDKTKELGLLVLSPTNLPPT